MKVVPTLKTGYLVCFFRVCECRAISESQLNGKNSDYSRESRPRVIISIVFLVLIRWLSGFNTLHRVFINLSLFCLRHFDLKKRLLYCESCCDTSLALCAPRFNWSICLMKLMKRRVMSVESSRTPGHSCRNIN